MDILKLAKKITVRRASGFNVTGQPSRVRAGTNLWPVDTLWRVLADGRATGYYVASAQPGKTMIDSEGRMVTCWHAGIGPGDLARLIASR